MGINPHCPLGINQDNVIAENRVKILVLRESSTLAFLSYIICLHWLLVL